ncbi:MAG: Imm1 family immunity protein [Actinomycetota bacterium]|nr:Imm1 family immunity protein [Actinomycetota bacterium]
MSSDAIRLQRLEKTMLDAYYATFRNGRYHAEDTYRVGSSAEVASFVTILASVDTGDAKIYRTTDESSQSLPQELLLAGIRDGRRGAMYFVDDTGEFYTKGSGPAESAVYGEDDFPPECEVPVTSIAQAISEFLTTGKRPTCVKWQK